MNSQSKKNQSFLLLCLGVFSVSTGAIFIRLVLSEAEPLVVATYRLLFSAVISILLLAIIKPKSNVVIEKSTWGWMALSGFLLAMHFASWISSLELVSVSSSVVMVSTTPLWVALLSPLILKEKVNLRFYIGMVLAILGGFLIALNENCELNASGFACMTNQNDSGGFSLSGIWLALVGAIMAAGYMMIGRKLSSKIDTLRYTAIVYSTAALFMVFIVFFRQEALVGYSNRVWFLFMALAIVPQLLGHSVLNYSLRTFPATTVSVALLGEPIGSTVLAMIFLNEIPSILQLIGGIFILIGIGYSIITKKPTINVA